MTHFATDDLRARMRDRLDIDSFRGPEKRALTPWPHNFTQASRHARLKADNYGVWATGTRSTT